jgi:DNA-binding Lrp family transcriptional regulator
MDEKVKLDLKDKKILDLLDGDARYSNSQIARKVQLSKPAVEYRLQRFEKNDIIFEFYSVIDFVKLGYSLYKVYFKFQNTNIVEEERISEYWIKNKNSIWVAQTRGRGDLAVTILAKDNFEFGRILNEFMSKNSKFILDKEILLTEQFSIYSKGKEFVYEKKKPYDLDETDKKILKELAVNARINIIDLAEKCNLTRDIVNYRIKKLIKEKIIVQYRCYLNLNKAGINLYKIIFRTKNLDKVAEERLRKYASLHKKIPQILKLIGSWDIEIEVETETEDELYKILNEIRKEFSDIIRDFDILRVTETYKYNYFPF